MNAKLFTVGLMLALCPGVVLADRPATPSLKQQVAQLAATVTRLKRDLEGTREELSATRAALAAVEGNSVLELDGLLGLEQDANGTDTVVFSGVNIQLVNGSGATNALNGRGNLVLGYNLDGSSAANRTGSHNIVLGDDQAYAGSGVLLTHDILSNRNLSLTVAKDLQASVGGSQQLSVGANRSVTVGGSQTTTIGANNSDTIGGMSELLVASDFNVQLGRDLNLAVARFASVQVGKELALDAGDELAIGSGSSSATLRKDGTIRIEGKDITIDGSGTIQVKAAGDVVIKGSKVVEN